MKTARNIKTGLDVSRKKKVPCRTVQIEDGIRKGIVQVHGNLLSDSEKDAIVQKEEKRIKKHARAITKAQIKILRKKEATTLVQVVRRGEYHTPGDEVHGVLKRKLPQVKRGFNAIDVAY
jgi:hypothetical protein